MRKIAKVSINEESLFVKKYRDGNVMPGLKINVVFDSESENPTVDTYYLYPFRGYSFQVCGTEEGQYDCGSTKVLGLGNLYNLCTKNVRSTWGFQSNLEWGTKNSSVCKELYLGLINTALMCFVNGFEFVYTKKTEDEKIRTRYLIDFDIAMIHSVVEKFAELCMVWAALKDGYNFVAAQVYNGWYVDDREKELILEMCSDLKERLVEDSNNEQ